MGMPHYHTTSDHRLNSPYGVSWGIVTEVFGPASASEIEMAPCHKTTSRCAFRLMPRAIDRKWLGSKVRRHDPQQIVSWEFVLMSGRRLTWNGGPGHRILLVMGLGWPEEKEGSENKTEASVHMGVVRGIGSWNTGK